MTAVPASPVASPATTHAAPPKARARPFLARLRGIGGDAPVTETAKFWGSVCTTFLGSGGIALAILLYQEHAERTHAERMAEFEARAERADAIDAFGTSIYSAAEATYRMMVAYEAWYEVSVDADPEVVRRLKAFVTASNAEELIQGKLVVPSDIELDDHEIRLYAQYLLRRKEYAGDASAQALCVGLQSRLQTTEAQAAVERLRTAIVALENRTACTCSGRAPHDVESSSCVDHQQSEVASHVDRTLEAISIEVCAPRQR